MVLVEEFGRGMAHREHLVALFDDELELRHAQTLWDRSFRCGLELGHEDVDVTLSPSRHRWALVIARLACDTLPKSSARLALIWSCMSSDLVDRAPTEVSSRYDEFCFV